MGLGFIGAPEHRCLPHAVFGDGEALCGGGDAVGLDPCGFVERGLALGGTSLFLLTQADDGRTTLWAK